MQKKPGVVLLFAALGAVVTLGLASWSSPGTIIPLQDPTPSATPITMASVEEDSWIIVDLPPDATQLQYGAEVYRLVCKACHGDKGQGLTDDWRAQWAPKDQNCWQSKCHAANHPPDGFYMPQSPAVVGPPVLIFETALDLYSYIHNFMPWHDRGSLTEKESWSVTAYILNLNNIDPGPNLNNETAARIRLREASVPSASAAPASDVGVAPVDELHEDASEFSPIWTTAIIAVLGLAFFGILMLYKRSTR